MIKSALNGDLDHLDYEKHPAFGLEMPLKCPNVPSEILNPRNTWQDKKAYDQKAIELETAKLIADDEVVKKSGIYPYILTRDEKHLSIRAFSDSMRQKVYERQNGICVKCGNHFEISQMEADHITPWHEGGKTTEENCQMLCKDDNRRKSGK